MAEFNIRMHRYRLNKYHEVLNKYGKHRFLRRWVDVSSIFAHLVRRVLGFLERAARSAHWLFPHRNEVRYVLNHNNILPFSRGARGRAS